MNSNILKWVGICDGVLLAAVTTLGQQVPALASDCNVAVQILGVLGTVLGGVHLSSLKKEEVVK